MLDLLEAQMIELILGLFNWGNSFPEWADVLISALQ